MSRAEILLVLCATACGGDSGGRPNCDAWMQWGQSADHLGSSCVAGAVTAAKPLATVAYDTLINDEKADADGEILVHYQAPLVVGDDLYMEWKAGVYTPCMTVDNVTTCDLHRRDTQVWSEKGFRWESGQLVEKWMFASDWKPMPDFGDFEPMFQPAVFGDFIYLPGAGGSVFKLTRKDGVTVSHIQPFGATDPDRYVTGGLTIDGDGNLFYNSVKLDHTNPFGTDVDAELVKVAPDGTFKTVTYQSLVPDAPAPADMCRGTFNTRTTPRPWPPADDVNGAVLPPTLFPCRSQRPSWNVAPSLGPDGTIFTVSRTHASDRYSWVVAVKPDLTPKWTRSLAKIFNDGCGSPFLPIDGDADHLFDCAIGARAGVDPATNELPSGRANDSASSSPVALPDGSVLYGAFTGYNISRGHLVKLGATGAILATFDFGWDVTPAVWQHDDTYSIILKDNFYTFDENGVDNGPYYIRQLDANLRSEWSYQSANTMSCGVGDDGTKTCVSDHPHGFEWCINAPAVDKDGTVYVNSEDGNVYAIPQGGSATATKSIFLNQAVGAAYTPVVLDQKGRIITLNNGKMTVLGP